MSGMSQPGTGGLRPPSAAVYAVRGYLVIELYIVAEAAKHRLSTAHLVCSPGFVHLAFRKVITARPGCLCHNIAHSHAHGRRGAGRSLIGGCPAVSA
jgi:hypothetical protein